ncbi:cache domain-containing sensor histidine kinase [Paenibacillus rigui]|uniref:histidine kinase n=1 Tax=Paenibacillus rigui TaxID=554312 RepID=A0A229UJC4_9BACL|nr:sensor histidine kinase [Paenibacillus rigui]OXM83405.1 histidine kinase [Paenibacillus rigui]
MKRHVSKWFAQTPSMLRGLVDARYWLLAYALFILLPAGFLLYSYYQKTTAILEQEVTRSMLQTMKQTGINVQYQLDRVKDTSNTLFMNPNLYSYLAESDEAYPIDVTKNLRLLLGAAENNENVFRVRLFVDDTKLYAGEKINFFPLETLKSRPWYSRVLEAGGSIVWTGAYEEHYIDKDDTYVFSIARMLRDPRVYDRFIGVLVIDMAEHVVSNLLHQVELSKHQTVYLTDKDGTVIWHPDKTRIGQPALSGEMVSRMAGAQEGIEKAVLGHENKYAVYTTIRYTGWKLVAEVPAGEIARQAVTLNRFSGAAFLLGVSVLFLLLVFVLLAFVIRSLNRRVQLVIRAIHKEGLEHLDEPQGKVAGNLNVLERSVDHMIHKVKDLMEETYTSKVQEREAQLRALQAQINPHFLYNTLDTINWIAVGHGATDISQMIDALAKYFRLSLNKGRDTVSVEDELNLAKVYLEIQQNRFPHRFDLTIEADPEVMGLMIPKLTLQPIVENALLHGIRKSPKQNGSIRIEATRTEEELLLSVSDNGIGMTEEQAAKLLTEPRPQSRTDGSGSSYGLYNVHERIRLFAGDGYGLTIDSVAGEGTTVRILLKARPSAINE